MLMTRIGKWVVYIVARSTLPPESDELTIGRMLADMKNNIFPLISTIIFP